MKVHMLFDLRISYGLSFTLFTYHLSIIILTFCLKTLDLPTTPLSYFKGITGIS